MTSAAAASWKRAEPSRASNRGRLPVRPAVMSAQTGQPRDAAMDAAAARMPGQVAGDVKRARSLAVKARAKAMKAARLSQAVGTTRPVLWEQPVALDGARLRWQGYTDHYLRVEATLPRGMRLENRILDTHLSAVCEGERLLGVPEISR